MSSYPPSTARPATSTGPDSAPDSGPHTLPQPVTPATRPWAAPFIIAACLASGAVTALVLALLVFAGAEESVITGSMLLAFAIGWALIAVLTGRLTSQPQQWALLPAAIMGIAGAMLLAVRPANDGLTAWNWVWPPVALALAARMFVQMRGALVGKGRWLLTPVIAVLAIAAIGATGENIALVHERAAYAAPGLMYDVGGHRLHLNCHGHGAPTVVLFNGLGEVSASWARVQDRVARTARVCAYDRAGQGWSEDSESPQDGIAAARDLHTLLAAAGEHGPYVLVGHSSGGSYAMTYAVEYPRELAGLVLLDSSSPYQLTRIPGFAGEFAVMRRAMALVPTLARLGVGRVRAATSHLPAPAADQVAALTRTAHAARAVRDEQSVLLAVFAQAQALTTLHNRPLAVLTASENLDTTGWGEAQARLADLSPNHVHRVVRSTHVGLLQDPHGSTESVRAITGVLSAARTGSGLATLSGQYG
jgi:pimeloyl-ACP methyl ester carboxylesterase